MSRRNGYLNVENPGDTSARGAFTKIVADGVPVSGANQRMMKLQGAGVPAGGDMKKPARQTPTREEVESQFAAMIHGKKTSAGTPLFQAVCRAYWKC